MKYIITEGQLLSIRRRFRDIDHLVSQRLTKEFDTKVISFTCGAFDDGDDFLGWLSDEVFNKVFMKFYLRSNTTREERDMLYEVIKQYIRDAHGENIKKEWHERCFGKGYG